MAITVIRHRVRDYDAWRKVYNSVGDMQKSGGVTEESVYQSKDDPNDVLVLHTFNSAEEAERFVASPELRDAMGRAGVEGAPRVEIFEEARRLART
jgi:heme-degrading monooxygenase HmoA